MAEVPDEQFPRSFFCPITDEVMADPVVDPEGNSYERAAIQDWLQRNSTSPVTRAPLAVRDLAPNRALREAIEGRYGELGLTPPAPPAAAPASAGAAAGDESCEGLVRQVALRVAAVEVPRAAASSDGAREVLVHASVVPPAGGAHRMAQSICCVVDISGSMSTQAQARNEKGDMEAHGLSLLDVVKHAVRTVAHSLGPADRLSVVAFGSQAHVVFENVHMTDGGKQEAERHLRGLSTRGQTNLWDGLHTGLEVLRRGASPDTVASILLLTDGQPNVEPPRGHIPMLRRYRDKHRELSCSVNTFGFGYNLDSALLRDLAVEGCGAYAFIPDSGMVGTCFVNAASNLMTSIGWNLSVSFELEDGARLEPASSDAVLGGLPCDVTTWGVQVRAPAVQLGQSKDVLVRVVLPEGAAVSVTARFDSVCGSQTRTAELGEVSAWESAGAAETIAQHNRLRVVSAIRAAMDVRRRSTDEALQIVRTLAEEVRASKAPNATPLAEDLSGQVCEALSRDDWYRRWGCHYLPSLVSAHALQQCNNFKDPGVQAYGGTYFEALRDEADAIFCKLPPPEPSVRARNTGYSASSSARSSSGSSATTKTKKISMKSYHCRSAPCFHGSSVVSMADGSDRQVQSVRAGDRVCTGRVGKGGMRETAQVACVVKTRCEGGVAQLVALGGTGRLLVTPWHPVLLSGRWCFPADVALPSKHSCDAVYSFVLRGVGESDGVGGKQHSAPKDANADVPHSIEIGGVPCITLGHGVRGDAVASHPFYGTDRVIKQLAAMRGWARGLVELRDGCAVRDSKSGLVHRLDVEAEVDPCE